MLEIRDLHVKFHNSSREAVGGVSYTIEDGEIQGLVGESGSGKTVTAMSIAGLLPRKQCEYSGQILLDDEDITDLSITERAKKGISFAFQQPVRFKGLTVRDLINLAAGKPLTVADACSYLSEVGLCARDYIDRELNASLSGGEMKRIEIAMIMARGTKLSLFDEPEAGIDLWSFNSLIKVFEKLRDQVGGSIMIISHQERILAIANQIVVVSGGKITKVGPAEEILPELLGKASTSCPVLINKI